MLVFIIFLYITPNFVNYLLKIYIVRVKKQISAMADLLADVKNENGNRRILSAESELTTPLTTLIGYLDKNERICRTADCHRCHSLNQCCLIKFPNRSILSVVSFLSARNGTFIQAGLSLGNFSIHYSDDEFIRVCRKSV